MYASIEEIKEHIVDVLKPELTITDPNFNEDLLEAKVSQVLDEAQAIKRYADVGYSERMILSDMSNGVPIFTAVSRYDYNQIGAEGQTQYSGDGESIHYVERGKLWYGWNPIARIT